MPVDGQQMQYEQQPYDVNEHYEEVNGQDMGQDSQQYVLAQGGEMQMQEQNDMDAIDMEADGEHEPEIVDESQAQMIAEEMMRDAVQEMGEEEEEEVVDEGEDSQ